MHFDLGARRSRVVLIGLFLALACETLAAYSLILPLPSFGFLLATATLALLASTGPIAVPQVAKVILALIVFSLLLNLVRFWGYTDRMPPAATLPYPVFIGLRYLVLVAFLAAIVASYNYVLASGPSRLLEVIFWLGSIVSVVGIYIYIAQRLGLWEPPRTRLGTGGQDYAVQSVRFSAGLRRALGTFREPSHMAQWLVGPVALALGLLPQLKSKLRRLAVSTAVLGLTAITLSGSLIGLFAMAAAISFYGLTQPAISGRRLLFLSPVLLGLLLLAILIGLQEGDLFNTVRIRVDALLEGGVMATNRSEIWVYINNQTPPLLGYGLGNASIELSAFRGTRLMSSHLSLFTNSYFSIGALGVCVIAVIVLGPLVRAGLDFRRGRTMLIPYALPCIAWIVNFAGDSEEFTVIYGVCVGLFWGVARLSHPSGASGRGSAGRSVIFRKRAGAH